MKIHFKALTGFGDERVVHFDSFELEKVQYAFLREKRVLLKNGEAVDGKYIQQIMPDYHATMGWNQQHKLSADDFNEIARKGIDTEANRLMTIARERVRFLIASNRENDIGKNVLLPELRQQSAYAPALAERLKA